MYVCAVLFDYGFGCFFLLLFWRKSFLSLRLLLIFKIYAMFHDQLGLVFCSCQELQIYDVYFNQHMRTSWTAFFWALSDRSSVVNLIVTEFVNTYGVCIFKCLWKIKELTRNLSDSKALICICRNYLSFVYEKLKQSK